MPNIRLLFAAISVCLLPLPLSAQDDAKDSPKDSADKAPAAKPEQWVTRRTVVIGGKTLAYVATAGTLIIRDSSDAPVASVGYVA